MHMHKNMCTHCDKQIHTLVFLSVKKVCVCVSDHCMLPLISAVRACPKQPYVDYTSHLRS